MTFISFIAEWYGKDAVSKYGFEPDCLSSSTHEFQEEANAAAIAGAEESWTQGWARVTKVEVVKGQNEYGPQYVNEHVDDKWCGWEEQEET